MGIWESIKEMIFGCKLVTVSELKTMIDIALDSVDENKDGYIDVNEFIRLIRTVAKYGRKH